MWGLVTCGAVELDSEPDNSEFPSFVMTSDTVWMAGVGDELYKIENASFSSCSGWQKQ